MSERRDPGKTARGLEGMSFKPVEKKKKLKPVSVYLRAETREKLDQVIEETGQNRHALMKYAISYFLEAYEKDKSILKYETVKTLKIP